MQLSTSKKLGIGLAAGALLSITAGLALTRNFTNIASNPSQQSEENLVGQTFSPDTQDPSQVAQAITEADTAKQALKVRSSSAGAFGQPALGVATDDGRVYNVFSAVNIRSCPGTNCKVLRVAQPGADLINDPSGGTQQANGYTWIRVTYGFASTNSCETTQYKGWVIVNPLAPGLANVRRGPLNIRSSPCNGRVMKSVPVGTKLNFFNADNQAQNKWYQVLVPGAGVGYVAGWDFVDVR